jgi:hypothetical protein
LRPLVGRLTAAAVGALAAASWEWQRDGGACPDTMAAEADLIAQLVMLRAATAGEIADFEATARSQALQMLQAQCGDRVSDALRATLVDDVLRIVARVCATQWHPMGPLEGHWTAVSKCNPECHLVYHFGNVPLPPPK